MQTIILSGNLGKDAETRQVGNDNVLSFSLGVKQGYGERSSTNWFRCSVWGKRGQTISQYLTKGVRAFVTGELTIGEYQGKPQFDVRVNEIEWERREGAASQPKQDTRRSRTAVEDDDEVPF